jgi:membrane-bound lytic murein transglycosylase D
MPDLNTPQVAIQQAAYLNHPQSLIRALQRSRRYMFHIVEELQKRGMPTELALLPVVESSFNPMARSPARALGLWQFIPSTGRHYDLEQNALIDERRDIIASTAAALDYLMNIYTLHGDWFLALASYNWGKAR